jgi:arylsulfatase A-like enzyme
MDPHRPYHRRGTPLGRRSPSEEGDPEAYDSEIRYVDGKIRELYERLGWGEDTLVVVTSDHGEEFREHGGTGHGHTLFGELIDVPLIFYGSPRWARGLVVGERVSTLDILPTLVELLGLSATMQHEGRSLATILNGEASETGGRGIYAHVELTPKGSASPRRVRSMIRGDWKLVIDSKLGANLYDLEGDPEERADLHDREAELALRLRTEMEALERKAPRHEAAGGVVELTPELNEQLRDLGYVQ